MQNNRCSGSAPALAERIQEKLERIVREKMPESRFFLQEDIDAVGELGKFSKLPHFSSDITVQAMPSRRNGRVHVPFSDPESHVCYYLACLEQNRETFEKIFAPL